MKPLHRHLHRLTSRQRVEQRERCCVAALATALALEHLILANRLRRCLRIEQLEQPLLQHLLLSLCAQREQVELTLQLLHLHVADQLGRQSSKGGLRLGCRRWAHTLAHKGRRRRRRRCLSHSRLRSVSGLVHHRSCHQAASRCCSRRSRRSHRLRRGSHLRCRRRLTSKARPHFCLTKGVQLLQVGLPKLLAPRVRGNGAALLLVPAPGVPELGAALPVLVDHLALDVLIVVEYGAVDVQHVVARVVEALLDPLVRLRRKGLTGGGAPVVDVVAEAREALRVVHPPLEDFEHEVAGLDIAGSGRTPRVLLVLAREGRVADRLQRRRVEDAHRQMQERVRVQPHGLGRPLVVRPQLPRGLVDPLLEDKGGRVREHVVVHRA